MMGKLKKYLIASETNDYRPWIITSGALLYFSVIVWSVRLVLPGSLILAQEYLDTADVMNRINQERSSRYIPTLATNNKLITAAQQKSDDMMNRKYFSHIDPDGNYVWPLIEKAGYQPYLTLGENLAMDFTSAEEMITAWMNSPTHRANLLNDKFEDQGLAKASGLFEEGHDTTIVTSLFGTLAKTATAANSQKNTSSSSGPLSIGSDANVSVTQVSGYSKVDLRIPISGSPTLVTAKLLGQSITLLSQGEGIYEGTFTFNISDDLNGQKIEIEARDGQNNRAAATVTLSNVQTLPQDEPISAPASGTKIPIPNEAVMFKIMRIIFGILSLIYLGFLAANAIIVRRAKVDRPGMHLTPQIVIFLLVAFVNIFF